MLDCIKDAVIIVNADGIVTYWNAAAEKMFGYTKKEAIGKPLWGLIAPNVEAMIAALRSEGTLELKAKRKNGEVFPVESISTFETNAVVVIRDITEKVKLREELETARKLYKLVIDNILDVIFLLDKDGFVQFANSSIEAYGYTLEDVIGKHFLEFVHPEDREAFKHVFQKRLAGCHDFHEYRVLTKDGKVRYCQSTSRAIYKNGELVGFVGIIRDITEKKEVENRLRESEEKFRMLTEKSLVGVYLIQDWKIVYANPRFAEILGYDCVNDVLGRSIFDFVHPDDRGLAERNVLLRLEGILDSAKYTLRILRKDGSVRIVEVYGSRINYKGKPAIIGTIIDRTEDFEVGEKLERYKRFYENAEDMFFILDERGRFVDVNPRYAEMLGCSKEELIGKNARPFIDPAEVELVRENFKKVLKGERVRYKAKAISRDGRAYIMEVTLWPIFKHGRVVEAEGILRDITQREELERKLREREELFRTLTEKSPTGIYLARGGKLIYVNPVVEEITGYSKEGLLEMDPFKLIHPDHLDIVRERYFRREKGESVPERYEFKIITKSGEERWIDVLATLVIIDGKPAVLGNFIDVTERKKMEESLRRLNRLLIASSEISQLIVRRVSKERLLKNACRILRKYGGFSSVCCKVDDKLIISGSRSIVRRCKFVKSESMVGYEYKVAKGLYSLSFPLKYGKKVYGFLAVLPPGELNAEGLQQLHNIARNISVALRYMDIAEECEIAFRQIKKNLEHFEFLADKLRNPLAVIKGYLEVREEFDDYEKIFREFEVQVERMEKILEELAEEEAKTYELERMLG